MALRMNAATTRLKLIQPHVERLLQSTLGIHGDDLERAVVQMQRDHAALGVDDTDLRRQNGLASALASASVRLCTNLAVLGWAAHAV